MKILIIRFSSIGDIILTSPIIRAVYEQIPGCEIHYLTKEAFRSTLEFNPHIHKIWTITSSVFELKNELKNEQFDFIIDLHKNLRSQQVKFLLNVKSGTFSKENIAKWALVNLKSRGIKSAHIVDRYFQATKHLGIKNEGKGLEYFLNPNEKFPFHEWDDKFQKDYIVYAIGGLHETKKLPSAKIIAVLKQLQQPIILLGGPGDKEVSEIIEKSGPFPHVLNLIGKTSLNGSAEIISKAKVVISHDSSMMHMAAAFKISLVSIWGSTVPEFGMYPYQSREEKYESKLIEIKELNCRPCSKIGHSSCPKKHFNCMEMISIGEICSSVEFLLNKP